MDNFEQLINRVSLLRGMGLTLEEIHDTVVKGDVSEEMFFFAYKSAELLEKEG